METGLGYREEHSGGGEGLSELSGCVSELPSELSITGSRPPGRIPSYILVAKATSTRGLSAEKTVPAARSRGESAPSILKIHYVNRQGNGPCHACSEL